MTGSIYIRALKHTEMYREEKCAPTRSFLAEWMDIGEN